MLFAKDTKGPNCVLTMARKTFVEKLPSRSSTRLNELLKVASKPGRKRQCGGNE